MVELHAGSVHVSVGRSLDPPSENSLLDILDDRVQKCPDRMLFCFLEEGEFETEKLTYERLSNRARAIAAELQSRASPGDRAILVYAPGLEFISAIFGCFYAGIVAVPVQPPKWDAVHGIRSLERIASNCSPKVILTDAVSAKSLGDFSLPSANLDWQHCLLTENVPDSAAADFQPQTIDRDTIAILQYTSGATGDPKGVIIRHGNILANEYVIQIANHHRTASRPGVGVCWLPMYHDMGLIGNVLQALYVDAPCYLMSPLILLQRPLRWLEAISRYRAHTSGGPNFAFDLCVRRITEEQKKTLDLSCWEVANIGAEPVSNLVIDRFVEAFQQCGFRREAFYPCYGLAEATLFVTGGDKEAPPVVRHFMQAEQGAVQPVDGAMISTPRIDDSMEKPRPDSSPSDEAKPIQTLVGCGWTWTDHELRIVHPETCRELPHGTVGEIWLRGPSIAGGYWQNPDETARTFGGVLSDSGEGPFLRTGDLGFLIDGHLFVSGRIKDLIVIRGHNHSPEDLEQTILTIDPAVRPNSVAAVGCPVDGEERLIILVEVTRALRTLDLDQLQRDIRFRISTEHQLQIHELVLLQPGSLPKTSSGKVRRNECRRRYLDGVLSRWKPETLT